MEPRMIDKPAFNIMGAVAHGKPDKMDSDFEFYPPDMTDTSPAYVYIPVVDKERV